MTLSEFTDVVLRGTKGVQRCCITITSNREKNSEYDLAIDTSPANAIRDVYATGTQSLRKAKRLAADLESALRVHRPGLPVGQVHREEKAA